MPKQWQCLADLFRVLENNKSLLNIKHYSITQTTLEQVWYLERLGRWHFGVCSKPPPAAFKLAR